MTTHGGVLVVNAEVDGRAGIALRVHSNRIVDVGPALRPEPRDLMVDARGGAVIPGLHDHHLHLRSMVAARESIALDGNSVDRVGGFEAALRTAAQMLPPGAWLRGVGAAGHDVEQLDRLALDAICDDRPIRIQHRGGALWIFNSAAINTLGVDAWSDGGVERAPDGTPTGRLWRLDHRVQSAEAAAWNVPPPSDALGDLSRRALRMGITGFTDATPHDDMRGVEQLAAYAVDRRIEQRLTIMTSPDLTEARLTCMGNRVSLGPVKFLLDDSALPGAAEFGERIARAHIAGRAAAVHCVTADQLVVAVAAFEAAGRSPRSSPNDRIEHAGVVPPGFAATLAGLNLTVVTQPGFISVRGDDYRRDVAPDEQPWLYPCASLIAAGVVVGASSDAPFGPFDPWLAISAATTRRTRSGAEVALAERISADRALRLYLGRPDSPGVPRRVAPGEPGDLCLLRSPIHEVLADLGSHQVAGTIVDGEVAEWDR